MRPALSDYQHLASGKVREIYRIDDDHLLFVASDRISAFDYILDNQIPDKGRILTAMSVFFFDYTRAPNHLAGPPDDPRIPDEVLGRALVVRKLDMIPVECVARGYLTGSGLLDYQKTGEVSGIALPPGLTEASKFDTPLFTPATKAELGEHDENISFAEVIDMVGAVRANQLRDLTLQTYLRAADHALTKGIIIADTKFEFGVDESGNLVLADEVFTPDSSRYWAVDTYREGVVQPSFDKQFVRNWLTSPESGWDRGGDKPPPRCRPRSSTPPGNVISKHTNAFRACGSPTGSGPPHEPNTGAAQSETGRAPPRVSRRRLHRPLRVAARQVRSRRDRIPGGGEHLHRADHRPSGTAAAEDLRRDKGPHQGDRSVGTHPPR